jgi:hypothetical protein
MDQGPRASVHFPIDGRSPWLQILRVIALGSFGALAVVLFMMFAVQGVSDETVMMLGGVCGFLILEYIVIRAVIVPRVADYGRFRVYPQKVDYYPLGLSGLTISTASDSAPLSDFAGITVQAVPNKGTFQVMLLSKQRGRTICLKTYNAAEPAHSHAEALADALRVGYAPHKTIAKTVTRAA